MNKKSTDYAELLKNPGFIAIAKAINTCTERAAYLKSIEGETKLKVWHNLDQRLLQHAEEESLFIQDLAQFIVDFQKEMSRIRGKNEYNDYLPDISFESIEYIFPLIDKFGSLVVAYSLVAAGYSSHRPPKADAVVADKVVENLHTEED